MSDEFENGDFLDDDEFEIGGSSLEDVKSGGLADQVDKAGMYHLKIDKAQIKSGDSKTLAKLNLKMEVLCGENPDQDGKALFDDIYLQQWVDSGDHEKGKEPMDEKKQQNLTRALYAFGVINEDQVENGYAFNKREIPTMLEGAEAIGKVSKENPSKRDREQGYDKPKYRVKFCTYYRLDDDEVQDVPKLSPGGSPGESPEIPADL